MGVEKSGGGGDGVIEGLTVAVGELEGVAVADGELEGVTVADAVLDVVGESESVDDSDEPAEGVCDGVCDGDGATQLVITTLPADPLAPPTAVCAMNVVAL